MATVLSTPAVAADGETVIEKLPYPVVHYPPRHGTFLAFGRHRRSVPMLCACARAPVENLLCLYGGDGTPSSNRFLLAHFPKALKSQLSSATLNDLSIQFAPGLCHQCNRTAPTLRYCDPLYGDDFVQAYGWYINQAHLRLGMLPGADRCASEVCPAEYRGQVEMAQTTQQAFEEECARLLEQAFTIERAGYDRALPWSEAQLTRMIGLRHQASQAHQQLRARVEALVRQERGL